MSVLVNCKEGALYRAFDDGGKAASGAGSANPSLLELQQAIIRHVQRLPSNDRCCDCNSTNGVCLVLLNIYTKLTKHFLASYWNYHVY